jgi:hypothetical protein
LGPVSSVDIATRYGLDGPGIENPVGARFPATVQTGPWTHPAFYIMGTGFFPGVKRPGRGVEHPPHLRPKLKEEKSYNSTPLWAFVACFRVNFTFTFTFTFTFIFTTFVSLYTFYYLLKSI